MASHRGSHHSSSHSHSGSHHSSSRSHSGSHRRSSTSGGGSYTSRTYSSRKTSKYRYKASSRQYYSDDDIPSSAVQYNGNWYKTSGACEYGLNMDDDYVKEHYDASKTSFLFKQGKKQPLLLIMWGYLFFFSIPLLFGLAGANIFYELFIPLFENANMTDMAFYIADEFIYYVQFLVPAVWLFAVPVMAIKKYRKSKEYERGLAIEAIDYYNQLSSYYNVCPYCGASAKPSGDKPVCYCEYCGRSLKKEDV